ARATAAIARQASRMKRDARTQAAAKASPAAVKRVFAGARSGEINKTNGERAHLNGGTLYPAAAPEAQEGRAAARQATPMATDRSFTTAGSHRVADSGASFCCSTQTTTASLRNHASAHKGTRHSATRLVHRLMLRGISIFRLAVVTF